MKVTILGTGAAEGIPALFCNCDTCRRARAAGGRDFRTRTQALVDDDLVIDFPPETFVHLSQAASTRRAYARCSSPIPTATTSIRRNVEPRPGVRARPDGGDSRLLRQCGRGRRVRRPFLLRGACRPGAVFGRTPVRDVRCGAVHGDGAAGHTHAPRAEPAVSDRVGTWAGALLWGTDSAYFGGDYGVLGFLTRRGVKLDMVFLDCTRALCEPDPGRHMNAAQVAALAGEMRALGLTDERTFVAATHFSHNGGATYDDLCAFFAPHGIEVAYDGMCVEVSGKVRPRFFDAETFSVYKTSSM